MQKKLLTRTLIVAITATLFSPFTPQKLNARNLPDFQVNKINPIPENRKEKGYITSIKSNGGKQDLNFSSKIKPSSGYTKDNQTLCLERGKTIRFTIKGDASKYLNTCNKFCYIDLNNDSKFNNRNELIASLKNDGFDAKNNTWTFSYTLPSWVMNTKGSIRFVFSDGETKNFDEILNSETPKGSDLVYDFGLEIITPSGLNPMYELVERISPGAGKKFLFEIINSNTDVFEIEQAGKKIAIRGNNWTTIGAGLNWYLKYYCGIHLFWDNMRADIPDNLPVVAKKERRESKTDLRYYLNYCTFSYSMGFWSWDRWEQEIDWMVLHGINLPLAITGTEMVWYKLLESYGYTKEQINQFVAGSGFQGWWLMNNLEAWGGPNPESYYTRQMELARKIITRYRDLDISPCYAGYCGMTPSNAPEQLSFNVTNQGKWQDFVRPSFLMPTDPNFELFANKYYEILEELYGTTKYYSMDPFHEGGSVKGVDLPAAGAALMKAAKRTNPDATWVIQSWQANPREALIGALPKGDVLALDLFAEARPCWGYAPSSWVRKEGYKQHEWIWCMLLNFGGNTGMYGKLNRVLQDYYSALDHPNGKNTLRGVGATMEGIENNPAMYELLYELPWRTGPMSREEFAGIYSQGRYGKVDNTIRKGWEILNNTVYNVPDDLVQEGTTENVFCGRPTFQKNMKVSSWGGPKVINYNTQEMRKGARLFVESADQYASNTNFTYDLVDIVRQTIADRAFELRLEIATDFEAGNKEAYYAKKATFLNMIDDLDRLLGTRKEFLLGNWIGKAHQMAGNDAEKTLYEWNARTLITTWGPASAANGGLRDYAHREYSGLLSGLYKQRWEKFFELADQAIEKGEKTIAEPDWFNTIEEPWTRMNNQYPTSPCGDPVEIAREVFNKYIVPVM